MGEFIGNIGAFFLLLGAIMLFIIFLRDINVIKDKNKLLANIKISAFTIAVGMVYYFVTAYMKNTIFGKTNIFDFNNIFTFFGMDKSVNAFETPTIRDGFLGLSMPLYPYLIHFIGGLVFDKFTGTALFLNFIGTAVGVCVLNNVLKNKDDLFFILFFPFMFLMFTPMGLGITAGILAVSIYAFYNNKKALWLISGIFALLLNKLGILFLLPLLVRKNVFKTSHKNPYIKNAIMYTEIIVTAAAMFLIIGGAR